jgi:hypothetical protein
VVWKDLKYKIKKKYILIIKIYVLNDIFKKKIIINFFHLFYLPLNPKKYNRENKMM